MILFLSFILKCMSIPLSHASLLIGINHLTMLFTTTAKAWILHRIRCRISFDKIRLGDPATTLYTATPSDFECFLRQIFVRHFFSKSTLVGKFKISSHPMFYDTCYAKMEERHFWNNHFNRRASTKHENLQINLSHNHIFFKIKSSCEHKICYTFRFHQQQTQ